MAGGRGKVLVCFRTNPDRIGLQGGLKGTISLLAWVQLKGQQRSRLGAVSLPPLAND